MPTKTLKEIEDFVSGTVVTELYVENNEYPYYYLGEACLGWAEYIDTSNFDPFELLGLTVKVIRVETADYDEELDSEIGKIINKNVESLTDTLAGIAALGPQVSIDRR
jgi:hypothetical protein